MPSTSSALPDVESEYAPEPGARNSIQHALDHAAHLLPDQAPLEMFVHHNTLHAFQHLPFHEALRQAQAVLGTAVYRSEAAFRADLAAGRITVDELRHELSRYLRQRELDANQSIGALCTREQLNRLALEHDLAPPSRAALRWQVREARFDRRLAFMPPAAAGDTIEAGRRYLAQVVPDETDQELARRFLGPNGTPRRMGERYSIPLSRDAILRTLERDPEPLIAGAMWQACRRVARQFSHTRGPTRARTATHRDVVLRRTRVDPWSLVNAELARWAAAYLDEGMAYWPMPTRDHGFWAGVREALLAAPTLVPPWLRRAARAFAELEVTPPLVVIERILAELGVEAGEVDGYVLSLARALPGFGGMFSRLERHPHERAALAPPTSFTEFMAVRLVLEQAALSEIARAHDLGSLARLDRSIVDAAEALHPDADTAYRLFLVAQLRGITLPALDRLDPAQASAILRELDAFDALERGRVFLEAYERHYREEILDGLRWIRPADPAWRPDRPTAQYVTCIDDREESFRRHLEEIDPNCETFGAAGSFGLAIDYCGLDGGHPITLAPAGVRPRHEIVERARPEDASLGRRRASLRRRWGLLLHQIFFGSRGGFRGALASLALGPIAWLPLTARVIAPRTSLEWMKRLGGWLIPAPRTRLTNDDAGGETTRGRAAGYTFAEQVDRVHALLEGMGLVEKFAPLVFLVAHGSTSLNNPHEAAHDCGACGGRRGGATARLLAYFANDPAVRAKVAEKGIEIPDDTWFIAGEHDTSDDRVDLYDVDLVPAERAADLAHARRVIDEARARNGHERARKFEKSALGKNAARGLRHVENRASHLGEPRPEYGHCTNSLCVVGRRSLSLGLFLDRRAFLVSYEPEIDPQGAVLERLLAIAAPVGGGINLEYYFSIVDPEGFGCGTKLPHNICGYLGVLNGTSGDLRTGLPLQMTEIHEPMRLLVIVEATPRTLLEIADRQPVVREMVVNGWIQLVSIDPGSGEMKVFEDGDFRVYDPHPRPLPQAATSNDYYGQSRDFLPPAHIEAALFERTR